MVILTIVIGLNSQAKMTPTQADIDFCKGIENDTDAFRSEAFYFAELFPDFPRPHEPIPTTDFSNITKKQRELSENMPTVIYGGRKINCSQLLAIYPPEPEPTDFSLSLGDDRNDRLSISLLLFSSFFFKTKGSIALVKPRFLSVVPVISLILIILR